MPTTDWRAVAEELAGDLRSIHKEAAAMQGDPDYSYRAAASFLGGMARRALSNFEAAQAGAPRWYREYEIRPSDIVFAEWSFAHRDYDGAKDGRDSRCGYGKSVEDCKAQIDYLEDERAERFQEARK